MVLVAKNITNAKIRSCFFEYLMANPLVFDLVLTGKKIKSKLNGYLRWQS